MRVVFRIDASLTIGTGHVMRCLTLAGALRGQGVPASFVCREHEGHLCDLIEERRFAVSRLPAPKAVAQAEDTPVHAAWLGASWQEDAGHTRAAIEASGAKPDWLVVDHYALDQRWESALRTSAGRIMVIDDLADRVHDCDLLLDQNLHAEMDRRYAGLLPHHAKQLLGPYFALLRPEFRKARESLRKRDGTLGRILVFFGGVDPTGETEKALDALQQLNRQDIAVDIVVGIGNPRADAIKAKCRGLRQVSFHRQVTNMAALMAAADLALGAGGSTTWERCAVGLPALVTITASNQEQTTLFTSGQGITSFLGKSCELMAKDYCAAIRALTSPKLRALERKGLALVDGLGASRTSSAILAYQESAW